MRSALLLRAAVLGTLLLCAPALLTMPGSSPMGGAAVAAAAVVLAALVSSVSVQALLLARAATGHVRPPLLAEERRLRGSYRRQSAPDTPGCPRRPRAPGRVHTA